MTRSDGGRRPSWTRRLTAVVLTSVSAAAVTVALILGRFLGML